MLPAQAAPPPQNLVVMGVGLADLAHPDTDADAVNAALFAFVDRENKEQPFRRLAMLADNVSFLRDAFALLFFLAHFLVRLARAGRARHRRLRWPAV